LLFAATPFLIPLVADRYAVSVGTAGLISAAQVSAFAITTFVAGRWWRPSRSKLLWATLIGCFFDIASALTDSFGLLLTLRLVAGAGGGVLTWLAWADAMRDAAALRNISAVGPITVLVGAPVLGLIGGAWGTAGLYWALALILLPVLFLLPSFEPIERSERRRMSPSRSNVVLLVALGVLTMSGSALFIFTGAIAADGIGMGAVTVSLGFSINAGAGLLGARWRNRPQRAWPWMIGISLAASLLVAVQVEAVYFLAMMGWGFAFWMAVPRVLTAVAEWSLVPEERVGDAQSVMAVGRAVGPVVGAVLVGAGTFGPLGVFAGVGLATAAITVGAVEHYRKQGTPPG
jgi:predicted MFS family arabinose efflux permease